MPLPQQELVEQHPSPSVVPEPDTTKSEPVQAEVSPAKTQLALDEVSAGSMSSGDPRDERRDRTTTDVATENAKWVEGLTAEGSKYDAAVARLYRILIKIGYTEARRRGARLHLAGPELEDIAHQAAADATLTICRKVETFRGDCRFTTWAYRFVAFDVSSKVNRHFWQRLTAAYGADEPGVLPTSPAHGPEAHAEGQDLLRAVERACADTLTEKQRTVFEAIAVQGTPVSQLASELGTTPNALYKTMFDARQKLRRALVADGFLNEPARAAQPE